MATTTATSSSIPNRPRVGVAVIVLNDKDQFVLGLRKGSHGSGTWALPGGHLEFNESFEECAAREIKEETGLDIVDIDFLTATNDIMTSEGKHYITIFVSARLADSTAEPQVLEPDKCERWQWQEWDELQKLAEGEDSDKLFLPIVNLFKQRPGVRTGRKAA